MMIFVGWGGLIICGVCDAFLIVMISFMGVSGLLNSICFVLLIFSDILGELLFECVLRNISDNNSKIDLCKISELLYLMMVFWCGMISLLDVFCIFGEFFMEKIDGFCMESLFLCILIVVLLFYIVVWIF